MPNIQSAKKALRQSITRRKKNLDRKNKLKTVLKEYRKTIKTGDEQKRKETLKQVYKTLDKLAKAKTIKKGKADRLKSRLSKKIKTS